jgi:hypothetical protein
MNRSDIRPGDVFKYPGNDSILTTGSSTAAGSAQSQAMSTFSTGGLDLEVERVFEYRAKPTDTKPNGSVEGDLAEQPHYTSLSPEPIDVIEGWGLGFRLGNAVKYLARAGRKPGQPASKDLAKAIRYIQREINALDGTKSW